jgi:hypothetical protein
VHRSLPRILDLRFRSLVRGSTVVLLSLVIAAFLADFPRNRPNPWILLPALTALAGTADTARCMQRRWNFYHGGVLLLLYTDLMAIAIIMVFLVYPYL